ncbi:MAG: methylated-DNA--[protein]-cysteine S-methyltransferase [Rhodobacteraceae bacterium]|nr:methylated-DNA--[protein]-cysteine S-methyltransferase [Paracoccaceae bacterium]
MTQNIESCYHYNVIARAIKVIDASDGDELPLEDLAAQLGMSPSHFQRLFSRWAGVSPKRYSQYLKLDHARMLLRQHATLFETASATGLSGSGRLHDLFIRWEAMTPGEFAREGEDVTIDFGWFDSPFGEMLAMATERGICGLAFTAECGRLESLADMRSRWPHALYRENPGAAANWVQAALQQRGDIRLLLAGGPFQIKVWEALLSIPSGYVTTYSELAAAAEMPKAVRAVATAVGRNPISWLIPCHRALRKSGALGGYHWGLGIKRSLLAWESIRRDAAA